MIQTMSILRVSAGEKGGASNGKGEACVHLYILGPQILPCVLSMVILLLKMTYKAGLQSLQSGLS